MGAVQSVASWRRFLGRMVTNVSLRATPIIAITSPSMCWMAAFCVGVGFASWVTVFPLFVSHLTDSALLIGLIPAVRTNYLAVTPGVHGTRRGLASRLKPAVVTLTIVERFPYVLFGVLALQLAGI